MRWIAIGPVLVGCSGAVLAFGGCFSPSYPQGLACGSGEQRCPPGQTCGRDNTCRSEHTTDASTSDDAATIDAPPVIGAWMLEDSGTTATLYGIWGVSLDELWAVGDGGVILRRTAGIWLIDDSPTTSTLRAVAGISPTFAWAVGHDSTMLRWDGATWTVDSTVTTAGNLAGVAFNSESDGMAIATSTVLRYSGMWNELGPPTAELTAVHGDGSEFWVAGSGSVFRSQIGGAGWVSQGATNMPIVYALWAPPNDMANMFAVGEAGGIRQLANGVWTDQTSGAAITYRALDGTSAFDVWAVGDGVAHRDASGTWTQEPESPNGNAVLALSTTDVFVVGANGTIYRRMP